MSVSLLIFALTFGITMAVILTGSNSNIIKNNSEPNISNNNNNSNNSNNNNNGIYDDSNGSEVGKLDNAGKMILVQKDENGKLKYSLDDGKTWTEDAPYFE